MDHTFEGFMIECIGKYLAVGVPAVDRGDHLCHSTTEWTGKIVVEADLFNLLGERGSPLPDFLSELWGEQDTGNGCTKQNEES